MQKLVVSLVVLFSLPAFAQVAAQRQDIIITGKKEASVARAAAYAPNIISKCSGSAAAGVQGLDVGISFAGTYKDEFCERAELIKLAISMGHGNVADDLFFEFPMVKDLYKKEETKEVCDYPTKCARLDR